MTPQSPSKKAPWDLPQFSQSPSAAPSYFPESYWQSEISSLSKVILFWKKPEVTEHQIWAVGELSHLGDLMFHQKTLYEAWWMSGPCCRGEASNHQLPIAFWIIQIVSSESCSRFTQNLMHIHCSTHSGILNATATQYTCSLNGIYCPQ